MNSFKIFSVLVLITVSLSVLVQEVRSKSVKINIDNKTEHSDFFKTLTKDEQMAIMKLAVEYYDSDRIQILPFPSDGSNFHPKSRDDLNGVLPYPLPSDPNQVIPGTLVPHFINGKVPKDFQKEFTNWLRTEYNFKDENFEQFKSTGSFCHSPTEDCPIMEDIGGLCCPFG